MRQRTVPNENIMKLDKKWQFEVFGLDLLSLYSSKMYIVFMEKNSAKVYDRT